MNKSKKTVEYILGFAVLVLVLWLGASRLASPMLFFKLVVGIGLGYTLTRSYLGFAGSVNRAYATGSTRLMRTLMYMFSLSATFTAALLLFKDPAADFDLWINPINFGLLLGGLLFGYGMTFSSCCASGVLTDMVTEFPKAIVTLIFFGLGVFIGFPIQRSAAWVQKSWFHSSSFENGVFLVDWFKGGPLSGYLAAVLLTLLFAGIVVACSFAYEKKRKSEGRLHQVPAEALQDNLEKVKVEDFKLFSHQTYQKLFVDPWSLATGAVILTLIFTSLMAVTGAGWGASTPFGNWFGKLLYSFGVDADALATFTKGSADPFVNPFFSIPSNVQNFGIILGTAIYLLTAGKLVETAKSAFKLHWWQFLLFAMGGLSMGFGTRLANGCNVGALYTPIANFSLSGWIWFLMMVLGGVIGNKLQKKIYDKLS
ncbi:MAG: YeeE/YedE family protein [Eubacteriales bacterium]|nr:YeeE/YedE family protein [Eubacteriales bacterium]